MRTPPADLTEADLRAVLAEAWRLTDLTLEYAPVGYGGHHWLARGADGPTWFVTAQRDTGGLATALEVAADLAAGAGLPFVVAPVRHRAGGVVAGCGDRYLVHVTRFIPDAHDWPSATAASPVHRAAVVELTASLHGALIPLGPYEDEFEIEERESLEDTLEDLDAPWGGGLYAEGVRGRLRAAAPGVRAALAGYDELVFLVQARDGPRVITHGEIKPGNLLTTPDGPALVDWDTVLLAPPERDLWWLTDPADLTAYTALTGHVVDPDALELYRLRWDLTDIAHYVHELPYAPARTADTDIAWRTLRQLLTDTGG